MICQESSWTVYGARDARRNWLVYGDRTSAALVSRLKSVGSFAVSLALSFSLLIAPCHFLVLLHSTLSIVHFAISIVRRRAAAGSPMQILAAVHALVCCHAAHVSRWTKKLGSLNRMYRRQANRRSAPT